jgi:hypothetical protein
MKVIQLAAPGLHIRELSNGVDLEASCPHSPNIALVLAWPLKEEGQAE